MELNSKANLDLSSLLPPSDTPNGDHKCPMEKCGKAFESLVDLTRHNSICHPYLGMTRVNELPEGAVLPFACPIPGCCRSFETQYSVNSHLKQTHMVDPWKDPAAVQAMVARYSIILQQNENLQTPQAASSSYSNCLQPNGYVPNSPAVSGSYSVSFQPNRNLPGVEAASASYSNSLQPNAYLPGTQAVSSSYANIQSGGNPGVVQSASSNKPNNNQSPRLDSAFYCPDSGCGRAFDTAYGVELHHKQAHHQEPYRKPRNGKGVSSNHSTKTASSNPGSFSQNMGQGPISNHSTQAASRHPVDFSQSLGQNVFSQSALPGQPWNFDLRNFNPNKTESISRPKNNVQTKNLSSELDATFPYQCHLCQVHDRNYKTYYEHMTQAHPNEGMLLQFRCFVEGCNRSFDQRGQRHGHVEVDHPGVKLKCPACSSTYARESGLWLHCRRGHLPAGEGRKYKCHHCTVSYILPSDVKRHAGIMHGEWGCTFGNCEWYFGTSTELNDHWNESHGRKAPIWVFNSRDLPKENPLILPPYRMLGDMSLRKDPIPIPRSSNKSQTPAVDSFGSPINYIRPIGSTGGENSFMTGPSGSHNVSYASPKPGLSALPGRRENSESAFYSASGNSIKSEFQTVPAELGINEDFGDGNIQFAGYDHQDQYGYPQYPDLEPDSINNGMEMGDDAGGDWSMCPVTPPDREQMPIDPVLLSLGPVPTASSRVPSSGVPGGVNFDDRQSSSEMPRRGLGAPSFTMPPSSMPENGFDGSNTQKGLLSMATRGSVKKPRKFGATDFANLPLEDKEVDINEWFQRATAKCAPEDMRYYSPESSDNDESVVEETGHRSETYLAENGYRVLETMKYHPDRSPSPFYPRSPTSSPKPPSVNTLSKLALPHPPKIVSSKPASKVSTSKANTMSSNGNDNRDLKPSEEHIEPMKFLAGTTVPGIQRRGRGRPRKRPLEDATMPAAEPPTKKPTVSSKLAPKQATAMDSRRDVGDFDRPRVITPQPKAPISEKDRREALGLKGETGRQKIRVVNSRQVRQPTSIRIKDSRANVKPPMKPTVKNSDPDNSDAELDDDDEYVEDMFGGLVKKPTTNSIANLTRHAANVAASAGASSAAAAAARKGKEKESRKPGGKR